MSELLNTPFHYSYVPGVSQYSSGVVAHDGFEIVRVRISGTPSIESAVESIESHLQKNDLKPTAVCAFELRSPRQFDFEGFTAFNSAYNGMLDRWGILLGNDENPVARSNVIPGPGKVETPGVHSFSYVRPKRENAESNTTFIVSGSAEVPEGLGGSYIDHIVALGDTSENGISEKSNWVLAELTRRMGVIGASWSDLTDVQVYTTLEYRNVQESISSRIKAVTNVVWQFCTPPVENLVFEMDCRRVLNEEIIFSA